MHVKCVTCTVGRVRAHTRDPELQARILSAATECFERVGLRRTTMDDVAQAAGVSRKTIYNYFANKTDLVGEVLVAESHRIHEQARAALDYSLPPDELIAAAEIAVLQVSKDSPYAG